MSSPCSSDRSWMGSSWVERVSIRIPGPSSWGSADKTGTSCSAGTSGRPPLPFLHHLYPSFRSLTIVELATRLQAVVGDTYRIVRELGGGGMSRVFLAEETRLSRQVVIKLLPPEMGAGVNVD